MSSKKSVAGTQAKIPKKTRAQSAASRATPPSQKTPGKSGQQAGQETFKISSALSEVTFPIVGVGASAGGLEAFTKLLQNLQPDSGMAFVLIQHLDPNHPSALTELLSRETSMPVKEATEGMVIMPNQVYVIPPNANLALLHGILHLMPRIQERGQHLSIDYFLRSLAEDQGANAIGVILSGTASDGVMGLKAIKAEGGITFSQDEESAKYDGMPHSAIAAGCVDFILPPDKIAQELMRIARHPYVAHEKGLEPIGVAPHSEEALNKIFILLRRQFGVDFTYYKQTTIQRRIRRRMLLHRLDRLSDFVRYLQENPAEVSALYHDILINVTSFFRDPENYDVLKEKVFPALVNKERNIEAPIRIWVPGCATGEEPYSIAIALLEYLGDTAGNVAIQIFATDIDEDALEKARNGIYPIAIEQDVSQERLRRFFIKTEAGYQISKHIRDMCLFARQNVIKDPPFSKLDLVSCRNLLIYLGPLLQKKVLTLFHYALKPPGFLLLGSAETIGEFADLYRLVDQKSKIYSKKSIATPLQIDFSMPAAAGVAGAATATPAMSSGEVGVTAWAVKDLQKEVDRVIMNRYGPSGVIVNENMDILQFRGHTGAYLEPAPGEASLNLLKMAREGLLPDLHVALTKSIKDGTHERKEGVRLKRADHEVRINIEVIPVKEPAGLRRFYLVVFQDVTEATKPGKLKPAGKSMGVAAGGEKRVAELERELSATKEYLQSVIEQQEGSNEELRSASEEIQSSNEELQSINEELETAKEELQSVNEELQSVNEELESRNLELSVVNNDLNNLVNSVNIPIVIVGRDLRIRRFSPQAEKTLNLIVGDVGRPIGNIKPNFPGLMLERMVDEVVDTVTSRELEAADNDGYWYSVRIRPYKTIDNKIDGAIIAFIDINEVKRSYELANTSRDYAEAVIAAMRHPLLVLDENLRVISASAAYYDAFKVTAKDTIGNLLYRLGNGQWGVPKLRNMLEDVLQKQSIFDDFELEHVFETIGAKKVCVSGRQIPAGVNRPALVLMQVEIQG